MSAFIVNKKHIDLLVTGIIHGTRDGILAPLPHKINPDFLGAHFQKENIASVAYRYSEAPDELAPYRYEHPNYIPTAAELRSCAACLDYQSCEHPAWQKSTACQWCRYVLDRIPSNVRSSHWEFTAETIAMCAAQADQDGLVLALSAQRNTGARAAFSDWCLERNLITEPLSDRCVIEVVEPAANANARRAAERVQHAKDYPHLTTKAQKPDYSPGKLAATNIRKELKAAFPKVKFSVTSDFNSVNIRWTCGPTEKEVDAIANRYKRGNFDGMDDSYKCNNDNTFADVFGDPEYVFTAREYPDGTDWESMWRTLAESYGVEYKGRETNLSTNGCAMWVTDLARRILGRSPLGERVHGIRRIDNPDASRHEDYWQAF